MPSSSSDDFDIPLMISLMKNIPSANNFPINVQNELTSIEDDLETMKRYRNSFSHYGKHEINASQFASDWQVLSETITRIGGSTYKSQCDALKDSHIPLAERERLRRELTARRYLDKIISSLHNNDKQTRLIADTEALINEELRESTFVETNASRCALELLKAKGVVLITGGAGTGKSRMGLMVLHNFQLTDSSYHAIKLNTIDEWENVDILNDDQKLVVLLDNIFGETNCTFNKGRDEPIIDKIYAYVQKGHAKLVITIRNTVKQHCTEIFENHRLFLFPLIDLNAPQYRLRSKEKEDMLVRHFSRTREGVQLQRGNLIDKDKILLSKDQLGIIIHSDPAHGFPLTVYRFANNKKFLDLGSKFFNSATYDIKEEVNKIRRRGNEDNMSCLQYAVLVYTALHGDSINTKDNNIVSEIKSIIVTAYGRQINCNKADISDAIEYMLKQRYLIKDPRGPCFHFSHITLQESVISSFADVDETNFNQIIPLLSLPFIVKIVRSADDTEKDGEVVLKVPQKCYPLLAERVLKLFLAHEDMFLLYSNIIYFQYSELFDKVGNEFLSLIVNSYFRTYNRLDHLSISVENNTDIIGVCLPVFLLKHAEMIKENTSNVVLIILSKLINESMQSSSGCKIVDDYKAAIVDSIYKLCSTGDVKDVKNALHIANTCKIHLSEDQFLLKSEMHESTLYIYQCISESFSSFNRPVMRHFIEKLKEETFDVHLFLRRMYADPQKRISLEAINILRNVAKFDDNIIEWMIKLSCERHLLPEVKYWFDLKDRTDANTIYIECFLKCSYCNTVEHNSEELVECRTLFKFLLNNFYHNVERINRILDLMQKGGMQYDGLLYDFLSVVDRRLLNFNTILSLACDIADVEAVRWVFDNIDKEPLDIKQSVIRAVTGTDTRHLYKHLKYKNKDTYANARLNIVECMLTPLNITEVKSEDVLNEVLTCKYFRIIQYFLENVKYDKIDTRKIVTRAIEGEELDFLKWILENGVKLHLDFNKALFALCSSKNTFKIDQIETLLEKLWKQVDDKGMLDQRKIVDEACENAKDFRIFIWLLEVFDHKLIDINKILTTSYTYGYLDVVSYIVEKVDRTLFEININLFFEKPGFVQNFANVDHNMVTTFLLSKSGFKDESLQTIMNESILRQHWHLVGALLVHCANETRIFNMETIVQACITAGKFDFLSWMISNEGTKHSIQFIDIEDLFMTKASVEEHESATTYNLDCPYLFRLITQIWNKIDNVHCDMNSIIKKMCCYERLNVDVLKWILDHVDHDCIDLDTILQSCCRNVETNLVKYMLSKVDKNKINMKSAFLEACRSNVKNNRLSVIVTSRPHTDYAYNRTIILIDFLLQEFSADMLTISEGLYIAKHQENYKLIHYFLANRRCNTIDIDMRSLLNAACSNGEYDLSLWILQNIPHTSLDLSLAFRNACICGLTENCEDSSFNIPSLQSITKNRGGLWCAMFISDKLDIPHSFDYEDLLSVTREKENTRMGQWLQYIFKSGRKYLTYMDTNPNSLYETRDVLFLRNFLAAALNSLHKKQ